MSLFNDLKSARQKRKDLLDGAGAILTRAQKERNRPLTREENHEFDRRQVEGDRLLTTIHDLEIRSDQALGNSIPYDSRSAGREDFGRNVRSGSGGGDAYTRNLEKEAMRTWMLEGPAGLSAEQRSMNFVHSVPFEQMTQEQRSLSATTGAAGAYTIPQGFSYEIDVALKEFGGIVTAADYIDTDAGNLFPYPNMNDTGNVGEIIAENTQVAGSTGSAAEQDMTFGVTNFNAWMFDTGFVLMPIQLLQDSGFDVEPMITKSLSTRLGRKLNTKCTLGSGTNEPRGVVTAATAGITAAGAAVITYTDLLGLKHSVDPAYRRQPKTGWMFNDASLKALKLLVDANGRPLFIAGGTAQGIQGPAPDTLDGDPITINQDMANIGTGNVSMLYGDFSKYKIRRVKQIQMVRAQERFIDALQIGFMAFARYDGNLVDAGTHPIKKLTHP